MNEENRPLDSWLLPAAVFLTALSVLVFEVSLTRAFSVLLRYHYVFLAVSLAVCGLGLGGLADYLLRRRFPAWRETRGLLVLPLLVLAVLYPAVVFLLFATPLAQHLASLWVLSAVCLPPFIAAGVFLSHVFARHSGVSGYLYFADLTGAALGAIGVIAVLQLVGGVNAAVACGLIIALAALVVAWWARGIGWILASLVALAGLGVLLQQNLAHRLVDLPYLTTGSPEVVKPLYQELGDPRHPARVVHTSWNAFARTDVVQFARADGRFYPEDDLLVYTDGEVPSNMIRFDGDLQKFADDYARFIGMYPFRVFSPQRVMLIGPGGGLDILQSLSVGATEIEGAEINPSVPAIVRQFRDFCGPVYDYRNVDIQVAEGRSYLSRTGKQYDLIYMALTKTATTSTSSMALVESYANTLEAFEEYFRHLSEDGVLAFIAQQPIIHLRAFATAWEAVQRQAGVDPVRALDHLILVDAAPEVARGGPYRHLLLMTRRPLTPERSRELAEQALAMGQLPVFFPGALEQEPFSLIRTRNLDGAGFLEAVNDRLEARYRVRLNFAPCPDDRPFVVDVMFGIPRQFWAFTAVSVLLVLLLSVVAWPSLRERDRLGAGVFSAQILYFSCLGIGFMLVEIALIQKLILYLGYPVLSLSVILFALLLGGGLGSLHSQRWSEAVLPRKLIGALVLILLWGLLLYATLAPLMRASLFLGIEYRSLLSMAILFPLAFAMGMLFPSGLRLLAAHSREAVPWMWGVNGLTSVTGSVLAMILAKFWGFSTVLLLGLALYALIIVLLARAWAFPPIAEEV